MDCRLTGDDRLGGAGIAGGTNESHNLSACSFGKLVATLVGTVSTGPDAYTTEPGGLTNLAGSTVTGCTAGIFKITSSWRDQELVAT
jgi:hypothetical protein